MFTLIKREIEDHIAHFLAALILSAIIIVVSITAISAISNYYPPFASSEFWSFFSITLVFALALVLGLLVMGAGQMYTDKARNVSAFLSALPVTRRQILIARIITGILAIVTLFIPLAIASAILLHLSGLPLPFYPIYHRLFGEMFIATLLMCLACYLLGLQTGWTSSKVTPALACLTLPFVLVSLILVKGLGQDTIVILIMFIIGSLIRTWEKFRATAL